MIDSYGGLDATAVKGMQTELANLKSSESDVVKLKSSKADLELKFNDLNDKFNALLKQNERYENERKLNSLKDQARKALRQNGIAEGAEDDGLMWAVNVLETAEDGSVRVKEGNSGNFPAGISVDSWAQFLKKSKPYLFGGSIGGGASGSSGNVVGIDSWTNTGENGGVNLAKAFPVTRGIIRSFDALPEGYTYMSVDGVDRLANVLENIENLDHVFIEMNSCPGGCINGPSAIARPGGLMKAESDIDAYVAHDKATRPMRPAPDAGVSLAYAHPRLRSKSRPATEKEIEDVLHRTGKFTKEDELNCGACGYSTCREKAWAVVNGYADIDICLPYMRKRAESLAVDIVRQSPEGVMIVDSDMNIMDCNATAMKLLGMTGRPEDNVGTAVDRFFPPLEFYNALNQHCRVENRCLHIKSTDRYISLTVSLLGEQNLLFGLMKDISDEVNYDKKLDKVKMDTISTTDELIMKQMRVAQEIASLLGETTAETKVALLKLKKTLADGKVDLQDDGRPTDWKTAKK